MKGLFALFFGLLFSQIPQFMQQYAFILQGHLSELIYINKHYVILPLQEREQVMQEAFTACHEASLWKKPFTFLYHLDLSIAKETLSHFKPGFYLTQESILYALSGFLLFYILIFVFEAVWPKYTKSRRLLFK